MRRMSDNWEPTLAEQQAHEDRPYDAMEERGPLVGRSCG